MPEKNNNSEWSGRLSAFFMDVAKYILTGVILSSLWTDINQKWIIYVLAVIILAACLIASYTIDANSRKKGK